MDYEELLRVAKPILFNADMVRAILDGRKTVTRRMVKPQHLKVLDSPYHETHPEVPDDALNKRLCESPYQLWDILYVRERFCKGKIECGENPDGTDAPYVSQENADTDFIPYEYCVRNNIGIEDVIWYPSIHMPKEAARIFLRVTDVRVERLQDITNDGALNEGVEGVKCDHAALGPYGCTDCMNTGWLEPPKTDFMYIWNSTIKKSDIDRYGWDANPWVWAIEFERVMVDE